MHQSQFEQPPLLARFHSQWERWAYNHSHSQSEKWLKGYVIEIEMFTFPLNWEHYWYLHYDDDDDNDGDDDDDDDDDDDGDDDDNAYVNKGFVTLEIFPLAFCVSVTSSVVVNFWESQQ